MVEKLQVKELNNKKSKLETHLDRFNEENLEFSSKQGQRKWKKTLQYPSLDSLERKECEFIGEEDWCKNG